ncbi:hypothetical protein L1987_38168 [Smallanthus sonchifolius]|uniref:Uncharacterized protein n=1 Tax=Smallanthus sonchifolius TaxID=185202 RepID=A0ACB9HJL6_9ASTR|nr:hypothetical protein L1987_38168 [Smallanthus sonchifolius]
MCSVFFLSIHFAIASGVYCFGYCCSCFLDSAFNVLMSIDEKGLGHCIVQLITEKFELRPLSYNCRVVDEWIVVGVDKLPQLLHEHPETCI